MKREKPSKEANYIEFKVEKEDWNVYKLEDETILKLRFVLSKVIRERVDKDGHPLYGVQASILNAVFPPSKLLGTPDTRTYSLEELEEAVTKSSMTFTAEKENYSSMYTFREVVGDLKFEVKPVLVAVAGTSKYTTRGEPIYIIRTQAIMRTSPYPLPKRMREEFLKLRKD